MPYVGGAAVGMRNMGVYAAGTTYYPNDFVAFGGVTYYATAPTIGNAPTNTGFWQSFAGVAPGAGAVAVMKWGTD